MNDPDRLDEVDLWRKLAVAWKAIRTKRNEIRVKNPAWKRQMCHMIATALWVQD